MKLLGLFLCALMTAGSLASLLASPAAAEEQEQLAVVVFELEGEGIDPELRETLTAVMRQEALQHQRYSLVNPATVQRHEVALIVGCDTSDLSCLRQIADYVEGQLLLFGEVRRQGEDLAILIDILDARADTEPLRLERLVSAGDDPVQAFQQEVEAAFRGLESLSETRLVIRAPAEDIPIRLQDIVVGYGEFRRQGLPPGEYQIALGERGTEMWTGRVALQAGEELIVEPDVVAAVVGVTPQDEVHQELHVPGARRSATSGPVDGEGRSNLGAYSIMGVGVASLAGSGLMFFLMRDVETSIAEENASGEMTSLRYEELTNRGSSYEIAHRVLLSVGVVALGVGASLATWNWAQSRSPSGLAIGIQLGDSDQASTSLHISGRW